VPHVLATSLYRDSSTDVLVERVDGSDWTVPFHNKNYRVLTDEQGCMLSATLPEYGVVIERRTDFNAAQYPLWPPHAAPPDGGYGASDVGIHAAQGHTLAGTLTRPLWREGIVGFRVGLTRPHSGPDSGVLLRQAAESWSH